MYATIGTSPSAMDFPRLSIGYDRLSPALGLAFWVSLPFVCFLIGGDWAAAGFVIGMVSLCLCPFFIYRFSDTREKLRIDRCGVTDFRSGRPTIPWDAIETYSWREVTTNGVPSEVSVDLVLRTGATMTLNLKHLTASIAEVCSAIDQGLRSAGYRTSIN